MNKHERHPIERSEGVTIYGRVIDKNGKLGRYEVFSDYLGSSGMVFHNYYEAETRMKALIGINKSNHKNN
jgi:hypothetical protein